MSKDTKESVQPPLPSFEEMIVELDEINEVPTGDAELAVVGASSLQTFSDNPVLDASDLYIPRLRLAQGLTAEVQSGTAKPGEWLLLGIDPMKTANVIPMMMTRRREYRADKSVDPQRTVLCRSGDSLVGSGNPGGECAVCPMNKWSDNGPGKKGTPPPCSFSYSYLVYVIEADSLALLEFTRTSITTGKMVNTMIMQRGIGRFAIALTSNSKSGPQGSYYLPVVSPGTASPEQFAAAVERSGMVK
jgi:hypothetical protein